MSTWVILMTSGDKLELRARTLATAWLLFTLDEMRPAGMRYTHNVPPGAKVQSITRSK
jgi:hypothetical protein